MNARREADPLVLYVRTMTGMQYSVDEIAEACGYNNRQAYIYNRDRDNLGADQIIACARHFELDVLDALESLGILSEDETTGGGSNFGRTTTLREVGQVAETKPARAKRRRGGVRDNLNYKPYG